MCNEQQAEDHGLAFVAPSVVSSDEWQALEWQLMALAVEAEAEGARS
ncbi:hypothetical protein NG726_17385 [Pseudomonas sp. MOB-449]|nr:hypothetical protein [Pseudomonas sp. MOB-449]